jgi:hypothetical protein
MNRKGKMPKDEHSRYSANPGYAVNSCLTVIKYIDGALSVLRAKGTKIFVRACLYHIASKTVVITAVFLF